MYAALCQAALLKGGGALCSLDRSLVRVQSACHCVASMRPACLKSAKALCSSGIPAGCQGCCTGGSACRPQPHSRPSDAGYGRAQECTAVTGFSASQV